MFDICMGVRRIMNYSEAWSIIEFQFDGHFMGSETTILLIQTNCLEMTHS